MKPEKFCTALLLLLLFSMSGGCGTFLGRNLSVTRNVSSSERNFAAALESLRAGNESVARDLLVRVVNEPALAGVTDEALFRLALLNLRDENGKGERRATELIERLLGEFPVSIWSRQAAPLAEYVQETVALRARTRELKALRNQNLSLSRDNKELRQSIERIKDLDLELEKKIRR